MLLIREPENKVDHNAVLAINSKGEKLGHLKKEDAAKISPLLEENLCKVDV